MQTLKRYGHLHVMRDCVWRQQRAQTAMNIPQTQIGNILLKDTEGKDKINFRFISGEFSDQNFNPSKNLSLMESPTGKSLDSQFWTSQHQWN